jgi:leucyl-tRNA synthetase
MQRNWIGRSEGSWIDFALPALPGEAKLRVFTTRIDTAYGVTFMAIAPNHSLASDIAAEGGRLNDLRVFAESCAAEATQYGPDEEKPKRGLYLGVQCVNPFNGEGVPVYATNYVLADFGTGAVMGVPAHDERDFAFAKENGLEIKMVIEAVGVAPARPETMVEASAGNAGRAGATPTVMTEKGTLINSGEFSGLDFAAAKAAMDAWLEARNVGGPAVTYKLRDWNVGRQRFWGAPIPMIHCEQCGWQPVPEHQLPVKLPDHADYSDLRVSPLANDEHWKYTTCPKCEGSAIRETDTLNTFMDSAWYFLRFCDPFNEGHAFSRKAIAAWMPVDYYVGGKEHAVGHLLYSRFITTVLERAGVFKLTRPDPEGALPTVPGEPFRRLFNQGIVYKDGAKMSKSKGNVVSSDGLAEQYGADTARLFAFFGGPYDQDLEWATSGVEGSSRFLRRVWRLAREVQNAQQGEPEHCGQACAAAIRARHIAVAGVTEDIKHWRFNTAIAKLMQYLNTLEEEWKQTAGTEDGGAFTSALLTLAQLLSPFAPHIAEEIWLNLGGTGLCAESEWPWFDPEALVSDTMELPVQVNGKLRGKITVAADAAAEDVLKLAKADEHIAQWLEGKELVKELVIPGRMVTLVVK